MTALTVENLSVRYGAVDAVRGLSLEVRPGQIVGLIGPNGAGKSSTLHAIMGSAPIAAATSGSTDSRSSDGGRRTWPAVALRSCPRAAASSASSPWRRTCASASPAGERERTATAWRGPTSSFRSCTSSARARRACCRAASSSSSRSVVRSPPIPEILLLDEPSLGLAPKIVDVVFEALRRSGTPASPSSSSSSAPSGRSPSPTSLTCSRTASFASRSARTTRATPIGSSPPTSHDPRASSTCIPWPRSRTRSRSAASTRSWPSESASSSACSASSTSPTGS